MIMHSPRKHQGARLLRTPGGNGRLLHGRQRRRGGGGGMFIAYHLKLIKILTIIIERAVWVCRQPVS